MALLSGERPQSHVYPSKAAQESDFFKACDTLDFWTHGASYIAHCLDLILDRNHEYKRVSRVCAARFLCGAYLHDPGTKAAVLQHADDLAEALVELVGLSKRRGSRGSAVQVENCCLLLSALHQRLLDVDMDDLQLRWERAAFDASATRQEGRTDVQSSSRAKGRKRRRVEPPRSPVLPAPPTPVYQDDDVPSAAKRPSRQVSLGPGAGRPLRRERPNMMEHAFSYSSELFRNAATFAPEPRTVSPNKGKRGHVLGVDGVVRPSYATRKRLRPRPSVLFGPNVASERFGPNASAADHQLGYTLPKTWVAFENRQGSAEDILAYPSPRKSPLGRARRAQTSEALLREKLRIDAFESMDEFRRQHTTLSPARDAATREFLDSAWTPRRGVKVDAVRAWEKSHPGPTSRLSSAPTRTPRRVDGRPSGKTPSTSSTTLAGFPYTYSSRAQSRRDVENDAHKYEELGGPLLEHPGTSNNVPGVDWARLVPFVENMRRTEHRERRASQQVHDSLTYLAEQERLWRREAEVNKPGVAKPVYVAWAAEALQRVWDAATGAQQAHKHAMDARIAAQSRALPPAFLWSRRLGAELGRRRLQLALACLLREFERNQLTQALAQWRVCVMSTWAQQSKRRYRQEAGARRMLLVVEKLRQRLLSKGWRRYRRIAAFLLWRSRYHVPTPIQTAWRRWLAYRRVLQRHKSGGFPDLNLAPFRRDLRFIVPPVIRQEKRRRWRAPIPLQARFRARERAREFLELRMKAVKLQSRFRMWSDRRVFLYVRAKVVQVQAAVRAGLGRMAHVRLKSATILIQRHARGRAARVLVAAILCSLHLHSEPVGLAATQIQRAWRAAAARQRAQRLRNEQHLRQTAALKVQTLWYQRKGQFSTVVLLAALRCQEVDERQLARHVGHRFRTWNARAIQRCYREYRTNRRSSAANAVQRRWRRRRRRRRRRAALMLQKMWRRHYAMVFAAAGKIGFAWLEAAPGRHRRHYELVLRRMSERRHREWLVARERFALRIQGVLRPYLWRLRRRRRLAATAIQRAVKRWLRRQEAQRRWLDHVQNAARRFYRTIFLHSSRAALESLLKRRSGAAGILTNFGRVVLAKLAVSRRRAELVDEAAAAEFVQRRYRRLLSDRAYMRAQRTLTNPYKDATHVVDILEHALGRAKQFYDPNVPARGMGVGRWLQRLGLPRSPVVAQRRSGAAKSASSTSSVLSTLDIRDWSDDGLASAGVVDARLLRPLNLTLADAGALARASVATPRSGDDQDATGEREVARVQSDMMILSSAQVESIFAQRYGVSLASAKRFSKKIASYPVTRHQLRHLFGAHQSASGARDHVEEVISKVDEDVDWDQRRLERSRSILRSALERVVDLLNVDMYIFDTFASCNMPLETRLQTLERSSRRLFDQCASALRLCNAAAIVQRNYRVYRFWKRAAELRYARVCRALLSAYLSERRKNYVRMFWAEEKEREREAYEEELRAFEEQQRRDAFDAQVAHVLPYGYREVYVDTTNSDGFAERHVGYVFSLDGDMHDDDGVTVVSEDMLSHVGVEMERPVYRWYHQDAGIVLCRAARAWLARTLLRRLKRARQRAEHEEQLRRAWLAAREVRRRGVRLTLTVHGGKAHPNLSDLLKAKKQQQEDQLKSLAVIEASEKTSALKVGLPVFVEILEGFFSGRIFQINPTPYSTVHGVFHYRKGTVGIIFDDGDVDPEVPLAKVFLPRLKVGVRVMAQLAEGDEYFPGIISGCNCRNGQTLSYRVEYDDGGDVDVALRREFIQLHEESVPQWKENVLRILSTVASLEDLLSKSLPKFAKHKLRTHVRVAVKYAKVPRPLGWTEIYDQRTGRTVYVHKRTGERRREEPAFTAEDEIAALRLQGAWRLLQARRALQHRLDAESHSLLDMLEAIEREASQHAHVGIGVVGMTAEVFLRRLGVEVEPKAAKNLKGVQAIHLAGPRGAKKLESLLPRGVATAAVALTRRYFRYAPEPLPGFEFLNGFSGVDDSRTVVECIRDSKDVLLGRLRQSWPKNERRVAKMAERLSQSRYPVSKMQVDAFLNKYKDKVALADTRICDAGDLVDKRTLDDDDRAAAALEVLLTGAERLLSLIRRFRIDGLSEHIEAHIVKAQEHKQTGTRYQQLHDALRPSGTSAVPVTCGHFLKGVECVGLRVIPVVRQWIHSSIFLQKAFRRHRMRRKFLALLQRRDERALVIANAFRSYRARVLAANLREQQVAIWEQLWDNERQVFYYYNKESESTTWDVPVNTAFRPMTRDRVSNVLIQAWPQLESETGSRTTTQAAKSGDVVEASTVVDHFRESLAQEIFDRGADGARGGLRMMGPSFFVAPDDGDNINEKTRKRFVPCCVCGKPARRRTHGPEIPPLDTLLATAREMGVELPKEAADFREVLVSAEYKCSSQRAVSLFKSCKTEMGSSQGNETPAEEAKRFWLAAVAHLEKQSEQYEDVYCNDDFFKGFAKGWRLHVAYEEFPPSWPCCVVCGVDFARVRCKVCDDFYCRNCFRQHHLAGKRSRHATEELKKPETLVLEQEQRELEAASKAAEEEEKRAEAEKEREKLLEKLRQRKERVEKEAFRLADEKVEGASALVSKLRSGKISKLLPPIELERTRKWIGKFIRR